MTDPGGRNLWQGWLGCRHRGRPFSMVRTSPRIRACQFLSSVWLLDPVHRGGHAEHPHEGARRFLVAGGDSAPLFEPRPETLDPIAVVVDPWGTGDVGFVALGRDRRAGAKVPDPRFQMRSRKAWLA